MQSPIPPLSSVFLSLTILLVIDLRASFRENFSGSLHVSAVEVLHGYM